MPHATQPRDASPVGIGATSGAHSAAAPPAAGGRSSGNGSPGVGSSRLTWTLAAILTLPPAAWAANAVLGRMAAGQVPPVLLNLLRWVVVLGLLLPAGARVLKRRDGLRRHAGYLAMLGLFGMGCYNALQYMALGTSSAVNVTLIGASGPLWMLLTGALLFGVRPGPPHIAAALLSLAGVVTVLTRGRWGELAALRLVPGDLLMLLAVACWSVYSWMLARPPASVRDDPQWPWPWAEFLLAQTAFGVLWSLLASGIEHAVRPTEWTWTPRLLAVVLFIGAVPGLLAYRAWGIGVAAVGPATAGFFANLTPVFTAVLSAAFLGEGPRGFHVAAFALIVAGIAASSGLLSKRR